MTNRNTNELLLRNSAVLENAAYVIEKSESKNLRVDPPTSCSPPPPPSQ